jgi:hypothetical protein
MTVNSKTKPVKKAVRSAMYSFRVTEAQRKAINEFFKTSGQVRKFLLTAIETMAGTPKTIG